jgi:hypothetical protein
MEIGQTINDLLGTYRSGSIVLEEVIRRGVYCFRRSDPKRKAGPKLGGGFGRAYLNRRMVSMVGEKAIGAW